jgi:hypothetical protein
MSQISDPCHLCLAWNRDGIAGFAAYILLGDSLLFEEALLKVSDGNLNRFDDVLGDKMLR